MKELTLIKRYHQIQERPKPPVEQRVKVMDTLDKKMQTILEKEDLSADERLKLFDQSFTRYLNVYDDDRPRPVAVALNPWNRTWSTTKFWKAYQKQWRPRYNSCWKKWRAVPTLAGTRKGNWNTRSTRVPQDLIGHEDCWRYITQTNRTPRSRKRQQSPSPIRLYSPKTPRNKRKEVQNWVDF